MFLLISHFSNVQLSKLSVASQHGSYIHNISPENKRLSGWQFILANRINLNYNWMTMNVTKMLFSNYYVVLLLQISNMTLICDNVPGSCHTPPDTLERFPQSSNFSFLKQENQVDWRAKQRRCRTKGVCGCVISDSPVANFGKSLLMHLSHL